MVLSARPEYPSPLCAYCPSITVFLIGVQPWEMMIDQSMKAIDLDNLLFRPVTYNEPLGTRVSWTGKGSIIILMKLSS